ncbi:hypothetical protein C6503_19565 [Candidatus Poribacteria bacterium]|nr:MAG: hypothetical protein C6503_19565 [Candidatus Poribacteria bacterium]
MTLRRYENMAKVGVFFSFEFDRDKDLYGDFFAQAKSKSPHAIRDYSLNKVHPPDDWKEKAEAHIRRSKVVIVVVGQDTHNAPGVDEEVKIAKRLGTPIFQLQPQKQNYGGLNGAGEIIPWKWDKINDKIDELLKQAQG